MIEGERRPWLENDRQQGNMAVTFTLQRTMSVLLAGALVLVAAGCVTAPSREEVLQKILPSAVQIVVEQREGRRIKSGSGVAIASRRTGEGVSCFVLTSGHTFSGLAGKTEIYAVFGRHLGPGQKARALLVASRNDSIDLALLRAESDQCDTASPAPTPVLGESIWVIGFPLGRHIMLSSGIVSQVGLESAADPAISTRLIVDAPVSYGASGGGVFDARTGRLIGLVEGFSTARVMAQGPPPAWYIDVPVPGQTLVIPLADIRRFLGEFEQADLLPP
jgi:S1-C subfamily serine protease